MSEQEAAKEATKETKRRKRTSSAHQEIRRAFVACPRCSFFLVGYDLIHDDLEASMADTDGKWLDLTWSMSTRKLVQKSYGIMINQVDSHYEGVCRECLRVFVFSTSDDEPPQVTFRVRINPRY
jgi:hypothetical protein